MGIGRVLVDRWGLRVERVEVLEGGMNSRVWLVIADGVQLVVKSVDQADDGFERGLELAARLDSAGLTTGAPIPSLRGRLVEPADDRLIALLQYVEGIPLVGGPEDQDEHRLIGTTLARVHEIAPARPVDLEKWLKIVTDLDEYLDYEPWIRPAVGDALAGVRELASQRELSWAGLHGDPAPEAFLRQPDGEIALIDWGGAIVPGPTLYDVASAVMYLGTPDHVVPAYLAERPQAADEFDAGLTTFLNLRYAVQAAYFAWRCTTDVQTGLTTADGNTKGLSDARQSLVGR